MRPARVLVLEHHRDLREVLVEALLDEGHIVTPARTVEAALVAIRTAGDSQLPDAIVVDAQGGRDLVNSVRADPRCHHVAIVSLSFAFDPATDADVDVRRPFRLDEFLAAVARALDERPPRGPASHPSA